MARLQKPNMPPSGRLPVPPFFRRPFSLLHIETVANPAQAVALMAITARITYNSARAGTG